MPQPQEAVAHLYEGETFNSDIDAYLRLAQDIAADVIQSRPMLRKVEHMPTSLTMAQYVATHGRQEMVASTAQTFASEALSQDQAAGNRMKFRELFWGVLLIRDRQEAGQGTLPSPTVVERQRDNPVFITALRYKARKTRGAYIAAHAKDHGWNEERIAIFVEHDVALEESRKSELHILRANLGMSRIRLQQLEVEEWSLMREINQLEESI